MFSVGEMVLTNHPKGEPTAKINDSQHHLAIGNINIFTRNFSAFTLQFHRILSTFTRNIHEIIIRTHRNLHSFASYLPRGIQLPKIG